jgi:hypothetical protein
MNGQLSRIWKEAVHGLRDVISIQLRGVTGEYLESLQS